MKRLFVGIRTSLPCTKGIAQCADQLARRAPDLKWVAPANYHVTIKFLGATRDEMVESLVDRLTKTIAGTPPFKLKAGKLGAFASLEKASVLWVGCDAPELAALFAKVEAVATGLGFPAETRAFHPHITIARARETRSLKDLVLPMSEQMFSDTRVEDLVLFESETKSSGSVYKEISRIAFKQPESVGEIAVQRQTNALDLGDETDDGWPRDVSRAGAHQGSTH